MLIYLVWYKKYIKKIPQNIFLIEILYLYLCIPNENNMKIIKYNINKSIDFQYVIESVVVEGFGENFILTNIHQDNDDEFYLFGTIEQHNKFMNIVFNDEYKFLYSGTAATITDVTKDVLYNIDNYENIANINSSNNLFLEFFYNNVDKDSVLDKILECGVDSLNSFDKQILQS
jgi:hypothetical protein